MKLMREVHLPIAGTYTLRMDVAMENGFRCQVSFPATSAWATRSEDGRHFYTGLQYLELTAEFPQVMQRIISELE